MSSRTKFVFFFGAMFFATVGILDLFGALPWPPMVLPSGMVIATWKTGIFWIFGGVAMVAPVLMAQDRWDDALAKLVREDGRGPDHNAAR